MAIWFDLVYKAINEPWIHVWTLILWNVFYPYNWLIVNQYAYLPIFKVICCPLLAQAPKVGDYRQKNTDIFLDISFFFDVKCSSGSAIFACAPQLGPALEQIPMTILENPKM